jgi:hypothetical protein
METNFNFKAALKEFGATDEQMAQLEKGELTVKNFAAEFTSNISKVEKERYLTDWDKDKKAALEKETQTGTYNSIKKKMFDTLKDLGITDEKFKDAKFEDILQEIPKRINESKAQYEARLQKADANVQNVAQLQSQLEAMQALAKEHEELKAKLPSMKEEAYKEVKSSYLVKDLQQSAFGSIENISPVVKFPFFQAYIDSMGYKVSVLDVEKGTYQILDSENRIIAKENKQSTYTDLKEYYADIAKREGFVLMSNPSTKEQIQIDPNAKPKIKIISY